MKLYHFCAAKHLDSILDSGLVLGRTPIQKDDPDPEYFQLAGYVNDTQWLTLNPSWDQQSWCTSETIPYRRNAFRLTVQIPTVASRKLLTAPKLCERYELSSRLWRDWEGSSDWRVFVGKIPPRWIVEVHRNPVGVPDEPSTLWCGGA